MCPIQQKNWVPFWSVILCALKRFHFQVWYIYMPREQVSWRVKMQFFQDPFLWFIMWSESYEREREREIAIYIMALSYTQLEKLNGLKPLHVRLNLEFDMVKIKRVFCNFMNCCWKQNNTHAGTRIAVVCKNSYNCNNVRVMLNYSTCKQEFWSWNPNVLIHILLHIFWVQIFGTIFRPWKEQLGKASPN